MITILGVVALAALIANLFFCVKNLSREVETENMVLSTFSNVVAVPGIILLVTILMNYAAS